MSDDGAGALTLAGSLNTAGRIEPASEGGPRRVLMTLDAVGGVWRYAMELAAATRSLGVETVFVGLGPSPSAEQMAEADAIGEMVWLDAPLDWMVTDERDLERLPRLLAETAASRNIELLHLNLPSQACGLECELPVLAVSHSCVVTWWDAMRQEPLPEEWQWQKLRNRAGFERADAVVAPSRSHADRVEHCYGALPNLEIVHNAASAMSTGEAKDDFVFAAGRWWDEGKNVHTLDLAAPDIRWPVQVAGSLVGPGGQQVAIEHVQALGPISKDAMLRHMRRAGIVASPSLYEPFGLVALEAAHAGCALVLADIPTYRELWSDAALFFDPNNATDLAGAINRLIAEPALRANMARRAGIRATLFSPQTQATIMNTLYGTLVGAEGTRQRERS